MNLAIVGSREYPNLAAVRDYVLKLPEGTVVVTGGAMGVDILAANVARSRGLVAIEFRPDYEKHGRRAPLVRNELIAMGCDRMVAFWDGVSTGTVHAVSCAKRLGRPVEVIRWDS